MKIRFSFCRRSRPATDGRRDAQPSPAPLPLSTTLESAASVLLRMRLAAIAASNGADPRKRN